MEMNQCSSLGLIKGSKHRCGMDAHYTVCARQTVRHANSHTHWAKWWVKWHRVTHQPRQTLSYSCPCCVCVTSKRIIHLHVWPLKCAAHRSALQPSITIGFPVTSSNSDKSMTSCLANAATHSVPLNQFQTTKVKLQKKACKNHILAFIHQFKPFVFSWKTVTELVE